jgi:hypothetical protein
MSEAIIIALIVAIPGTLTALAGVVVSLRNSRKLDEVHKTTNSLAVRNEQVAKELGIAEGKATERKNPT